MVAYSWLNCGSSYLASEPYPQGFCFEMFTLGFLVYSRARPSVYIDSAQFLPELFP